VITVVLVDLAAAASGLARIEQDTPRLARDEIARAAAIADAGRRRAWLAAHTALRLVLERAAGPGVRGRVFATGAYGRPELPVGGPVFSLSHTAGLAAIAVAARGHLGVDIEARRAVLVGVARRDLMMAAAAALGPAPADLIDAWTRLEAVGKARGTGVGAVLEALRWDAATSEPGAAAAMQGLVAAAGLAVHDLSVPEGYAGALAARADLGRPRLEWLPTGPDALATYAAASNAVDLAEPTGHKGA